MKSRTRNIPYRVHWRKSANWESLKNILQSPACHYFYISAHGNYEWKGVQRTVFWIADGMVFSYTEGIPGEDNVTRYSLLSLGLEDSGKMKLVWLDTCHSGWYDDMAYSFGMYSSNNYNYMDQVYVGFAGQIGYYPDINYTYYFWDYLSQGYYVSQAYSLVVLHHYLEVFPMPDITAVAGWPEGVVLPQH